MKLLDVFHVSKVYRVESGEPLPVLRDVSFEANSGKIIAVVGESMCGKSTLGKIVAGLEEPTSGEVRVAGRIVERPGRGIVLVPQLPVLIPWMSLHENVKFGLIGSRLPKHEKEERVSRCMKELGLDPYANCYPRQVPVSVKQAACIARALVSDFDLLVLDEPFTNLDPNIIDKLADVAIELCNTTERDVLVLTRYIDRAIEIADRLVLLTPRPAEVKAIVDVNLKKPRDRSGSSFKRFCKFVKQLVLQCNEHNKAEERQAPLITKA